MSADFKKEQLFLYEELEKWQDQYPKYLISLQNQLFDRNGLGGVLPSLAEMIACDADKTVRLLDNMEKIVNRTKQGGIAAIAAKDLTEKTWANYHSSFTASQKIIKDFIDSPLSSRLVSKGKKWTEDYKKWFQKAYLLAYRIDGTDSLLKEIGSEVCKFVSLVLENSFFFDPQVVRERHEYICTEYKTGRQLPARWTEKYREVYKFGKKQIIKLSQDANRKAIKYMGHPVKIDKDGNNAVRSLINKEFGYTVSQGQASLFQSYKISHIWGEAYDPRKFTNLWNLVLVPAWANDLLDKTFSGDELTVTFKQIIKQICIQFYGMKTLDWGDDFMEMPSWQEEHEADLLEKYNGKVFGIKWIEARKSKPLGEIKTKKITIKI